MTHRSSTIGIHSCPHCQSAKQLCCQDRSKMWPCVQDWHRLFAPLPISKAALLSGQVKDVAMHPGCVIPKTGQHYLVRRRPRHRGPSQQSGAQRGGHWPWPWQPQWRQGAPLQPWGSRSPAVPPWQTQSPAPTPGWPGSCATASPGTPSPAPTTTCLSLLQPLHCSRELLCLCVALCPQRAQ